MKPDLQLTASCNNIFVTVAQMDHPHKTSVAGNEQEVFVFKVVTPARLPNKEQGSYYFYKGSRKPHKRKGSPLVEQCGVTCKTTQHLRRSTSVTAVRFGKERLLVLFITAVV
jgi:hypothetical protein